MVLFFCYNGFMKKFICFLTAILLLLLASCAKLLEPAPTEEIVEKSPVVIGIIDTGFSTRAIPSENILEGKNYLAPDASAEDTYGHGTAIASVILSRMPDAQLVPLVSNAYDGGKLLQVDNDTFAQIIREAVEVYHCDILNISAGLVLDKESVREAIAYAEENNVLIVASVGNDYVENGSLRYYPAAYETVLAVGSVNPEETAISSFSQRGPWVDLYTCGEKITIHTLSGNTRESDGTSYSAALVTAQAAQLLAQSDTAMTPIQLREQILQMTESLEDGSRYLPQQ